MAAVGALMRKKGKGKKKAPMNYHTEGSARAHLGLRPDAHGFTGPWANRGVGGEKDSLLRRLGDGVPKIPFNLA